MSSLHETSTVPEQELRSSCVISWMVTFQRKMTILRRVTILEMAIILEMVTFVGLVTFIGLGEPPKKIMSQIVEKVHNFLDPPPPRIIWTFLNLGKN